jgi:hypothetical protein
MTPSNLCRNTEPENERPLMVMVPEGKQSMDNIDLPKRVTKQLDKIPDKNYPSISRAIQNLKGIPCPTGCKKLHEALYRLENNIKNKVRQETF